MDLQGNCTGKPPIICRNNGIYSRPQKSKSLGRRGVHAVLMVAAIFLTLRKGLYGMTGILHSTQKLTILLAGTHKDGPYKELIVCNRLICFSEALVLQACSSS